MTQPRLGGTGSNGSFMNGSRNSPTNPAAQSTQRPNAGVVNWSHIVLPSAVNFPVPCPAYRVPPGCSVRIRGSNGKTGGNGGLVFVARDRRTLLNGGGQALGNFDDIAFPAHSTGEIWVMIVNAGDGVTISAISSAASNS